MATSRIKLVTDGLRVHIKCGHHLQSGFVSIVSRKQSTMVQEKTRADTTKPFSDIPGPSGVYDIPYLGLAFLFKPFTNHQLSSMNELFDDLRQRYGDIVKLRIKKSHMVVILNPELVKSVYTIPDKYPFRPSLQILTTYNKRSKRDAGFNSQGEQWASVRKPLQQKLLRPLSVVSYIPTLNKVATDLVKVLQENDGRLDDCLKMMYAYTTESIGMLCFNRRLGTLDGSSGMDLMEDMQTFFYCLPERHSLFSLYPYFRTPFYRKFEKAADKLYGIATKETRRELENIEQLRKAGKLEETAEKSPNLLLSLLSDPKIPTERACMMATDLFIGGVDSTSNTLTLLLHKLALHQDKQKNLYQEIKTYVGQGELSKESLDKMSYLKACLKESLRSTFPINPGIARVFDRDVTIGGYNIPKQIPILSSLTSMVKDARYFSNPDEFLPERFLRGNAEESSHMNHPFVFLPFGYGPRSCIGQRFAETEIYVAATKLIQSFKLSLPPGSEEMDIVYHTFATPARKVTLLLEKR